MKILLINGVYKKGSTGNIVETLFNGYKQEGHDPYLIYGRGDRKYVSNSNHIYNKTLEIESKIHHLFSLFTGNMYGGMHISTYRITKLIKKINPDVVHLHCLNGYFVNIYSLINYLKKNHIKTILTMHADFMMTGGCGYSLDCTKYLTDGCKCCPRVSSYNGKLSLNRTHHFYKKMYNSIKEFKELQVTCVSPWLTSRYKASPIYKDVPISTVLNPVDPIFFKKGVNNPYIYEKNVLYVTPDIFEPEKGGDQLEEIMQALTDIHFTIISAKARDYKANCNNYTYISGGVDKATLRYYYYFANCVLILSKRETFSMVVAEAQTCGTYVIGYKNGGSETIAYKDLSSFVEPNKMNELINETKHNINSPKIRRSLYCFDKKTISNEYINLMKK